MKRIRHRKNSRAPLSGSPYHSRRLDVEVELVELEDSSFHLVVPVDIDGVKGDMIVDTGASVTVVERKLFFSNYAKLFQRLFELFRIEAFARMPKAVVFQSRYDPVFATVYVNDLLNHLLRLLLYFEVFEWNVMVF